MFFLVILITFLLFLFVPNKYFLLLFFIEIHVLDNMNKMDRIGFIGFISLSLISVKILESHLFSYSLAKSKLLLPY